MEKQRVTFVSECLKLVGDLYLPRESSNQPAPAIVFTGPFTGVKEQVTGNYARRLAQAGFVTLAFDHRNFGESEGAPRQHEDAQGKLADLRDALSFLASRPEVDANRIGACGVCLGGVYALPLAAFDPRVKALSLVTCAYNEPSRLLKLIGTDGYRQQMENAAAVAGRQYQTGEVEYLPAVAPNNGMAAMWGPEPYDYYGTARSASPGWVNQVSVLSIKTLLTLTVAYTLPPVISTPTLIVHGKTDGFCPPEDAAWVYEQLAEPKDILWLPTSNHIDLYDNDEFVIPAVTATAAWFKKYLS
ncbi:MAG TPA: alpha/beta hydrolase [Ktedonosporobacter sp.]|nr:alpha/beta hydrolase [Ktedonosporobacter sp.]